MTKKTLMWRDERTTSSTQNCNRVFRVQWKYLCEVSDHDSIYLFYSCITTRNIWEFLDRFQDNYEFIAHDGFVIIFNGSVGIMSSIEWSVFLFSNAFNSVSIFAIANSAELSLLQMRFGNGRQCLIDASWPINKFCCL